MSYETWYSDWMKMLAKQHTREELERLLYGARHDVQKAAQQHIRAVQKSHSMGGNSMARAHGRNRVEASGETAIAITGAIEIHELFPEHAKQ
ncbi:hypothetical protein [Corticibacter populi]|uniref:hypothetical protein n=1 Tax=Corticibacter populi TaxID=1550736 RepID=UPI00102B53EA|nr:hypothetical protein [Corticibacter populi]